MIVLSIIYAAALVWLSALVQHGANLKTNGSTYVMGDRSQTVSNDGLSGRAARALRNNMESALMYVPVAIVAMTLHLASPIARWVAVIYMVVRTTFSVAYWFRINAVRSLSWLTGMICIAVLGAVTLLAVQ